jgi:hypothetical protein
VIPDVTVVRTTARESDSTVELRLYVMTGIVVHDHRSG